MLERFTTCAKRAMALANEEAQRLNHEFIGTEHILLGITLEGSGTGAKVLKGLQIDFGNLQMEVERRSANGPDEVAPGKLPATPRAKKVIEFAVEECHAAGRDCVGTEHLLLALMRTKDGIAAQVLTDMTVSAEALRRETLKLTASGEREI